VTTPSLSHDLGVVGRRVPCEFPDESATSSLSYDIDVVAHSAARLHHSLEARLAIHR